MVPQDSDGVVYADVAKGKQRSCANYCYLYVYGKHCNVSMNSLFLARVTVLVVVPSIQPGSYDQIFEA